MPTRVFKVAEFARFARKARISDAVLVEAIERAERGLVDADLGGGVVKLRIARPNQGRSDGFRTIVALLVGERAFFMFVYAKSDLSNIGRTALEGFREAAGTFLGVDEEGLDILIGRGDITEVER